MNDDLVERLRDPEHPDPTLNLRTEAADRIEELEAALLDVAKYVSIFDLCHYVEPETREVLNEIGEKKND